MNREAQRMIRHGLAPLVAYAVAQGWLPEWAQNDVLEMLAIGLALGVPYAWSWLREKKAAT